MSATMYRRNHLKCECRDDAGHACFVNHALRIFDDYETWVALFDRKPAKFPFDSDDEPAKDCVALDSDVCAVLAARTKDGWGLWAWDGNNYTLTTSGDPVEVSHAFANLYRTPKSSNGCSFYGPNGDLGKWW